MRPWLCAALLLSLGARPSSAHVICDRETRILKELEPGWSSGLAAEDRPEPSGLVGPNRSGGWKGVAFQCGAMLLLADACARADSTTAEQAWRAIDAAFEHQLPSGGFEAQAREGDVGAGHLDELRATALWIAELNRAIVVMTNSPLQERFNWSWALLLPKLRRSIDWLAAGTDTLESASATNARELLTIAQAFLLADGLYHQELYNRLGQRALVTALALQCDDGAFPVDGVASGSDQARALIALQEIAIYFPAPSLDQAVERGAHWLMRQVSGGGELRASHDRSRVHAASASVFETPGAGERDAAEMLAYFSQRSGDSGAHRCAERLRSFCISRSHPASSRSR